MVMRLNRRWQFSAVLLCKKRRKQSVPDLKGFINRSQTGPGLDIWCLQYECMNNSFISISIHFECVLANIYVP